MHQAKKRFGQNFLTDKNLLKKIVEAAQIKDKNVLEIGPGLGALTQFLVLDAKKYLAYEIDYSLQNVLSKFEDKNIKFIFNDFLEAEVEYDLGNYFKDEDVHLIGNLPYYITTPIIFKFLELKQLQSATIMVQKEVGDRMASQQNIKSYNAFSVILQHYADVRIVMNVNKKMFKPVPKVDSVVIKLTKKETYLTPEEEKLFIKIVKLGFMHKRKTLLNNLSTGLEVDKIKILEILKENGFNETTRGESLSVADFIKLMKCINEK